MDTKGKHWASRPLDVDANQTIVALRRAFPVSLISTLDSQLKTCVSLEEACGPSFFAYKFDYIPLSLNGKLCGVCDTLNNKIIDIKECLCLGASDSLLHFIESIKDKTHFALILDNGNIIGIATYADLQKLPVFPLVFGVLMTVEQLVVEWLRLKYNGRVDDWILHLDKDDKKQIEKYWDKSCEDNTAIDKLSCAGFRHEYIAAAGSGLFANDSKSLGVLKSCVKIRNEICHGMDIANTRKRGLEFPDIVRSALELIGALQSIVNEMKPKSQISF